jgi:5-methyltetrahydropteroyltriglutamate--homocysteine methyltransferase
MDSDNPAKVPARTPGAFQIVPRVIGKIRRRRPVQVRDVEFLRANTDRTIKMTIPGPFTMTQQLYDEYYKNEFALAMDCAEALNAEIKDFFSAGVDVVQLDEPFLQARPEEAQRVGVQAINRALEGIKGTTAVHICFGYAARVKNKPTGYSFLAELEQSKADQISIETAQSHLDLSVLAKLPSKQIILGVIDLADMSVETPEQIAERIRRALPYVPAERIIVAPDCGMKYLPRDIAFGKMKAMADGAAIVRREIGR